MKRLLVFGIAAMLSVSAFSAKPWVSANPGKEKKTPPLEKPTARPSAIVVSSITAQ